MKERALIELIAAMNTGGGEVIQGIGDDCAVIAGAGRQVLLCTMDTLVEDVHFDLRWHRPCDLGNKAVAVNVSDIAAMGGQPRYSLLSLALPAKLLDSFQQELLMGITDACREYGCKLIGGDTVFSPRGLQISMTMIGEASMNTVRYRHAAQPGDAVFVTGSLGNAAAGLRLFQETDCKEQTPPYPRLLSAHLAPQAQLGAAQVLAGSGLVHAMMDISDGLATDLAHICHASGVGARVEGALLPVDQELVNCCAAWNWDAYHLMLRGGEDYQLLFTAGFEHKEVLCRLGLENGFHVSRIGAIIEGSGVLFYHDGEEQDISYQGYEHG